MPDVAISRYNLIYHPRVICSYKSSQWGFNSIINDVFLSLFQLFICFSRSSAAFTSDVSSK